MPGSDSPLRVGFDVGPLRGHRTGIGVAVAALHDELARRPDAVELRPYVLSLRARLKGSPPIPAFVAHRLWARCNVPRVDRWLGGVDVVHGTNYVVPPSRQPRVVSVYDAWFLTHPHHVSPTVRRAGRAMLRAIDSGAFAQVSSAATATVLAEFAPTERVRVIHLGAPDLPVPSPVNPLPQLGSGRFVLAVGTAEPRKNLPRLVAAFGGVAREFDDVRLVIAGAAGADSPAIASAIDALGPLGSRVFVTGPVTEADRGWLLTHAAALAYPSLDEGFGFPLLEAMRAGVPVVASTAGSIPEIAGDAAELVDATDVEAMAAALARAISDGADRQRLIERGQQQWQRFTWDSTATQMIDLYRTAAATGGDR